MDRGGAGADEYGRVYHAGMKISALNLDGIRVNLCSSVVKSLPPNPIFKPRTVAIVEPRMNTD